MIDLPRNETKQQTTNNIYMTTMEETDVKANKFEFEIE